MVDRNRVGRDQDSQAYIVRIWRNEAGGRWRYSIQDVATGERSGFADLDSFLVHFYALIPRASAGTGPIADRLEPDGSDEG